MKITNNSGLPERIFKVLTEKEYSRGGADFSVTDLIKPTQQLVLMRKYNHLLSSDISEMIFQLIGTGVHYILSDLLREQAIERLYTNLSDRINNNLPLKREELKEWIESVNKTADPTKVLEKRFFINIDGLGTLSGAPDLIDLTEKRIEDWKVTSAYKVMKADYKDWETQLNVYRLLIKYTDNIEITSLRVNAIIRDYKSSETKPGYPASPVAMIELPVWSYEEANKFVREKLLYIKNAMSMEDDELFMSTPCSQEDIWARPAKYSVQKIGASRASKVFDIEKEAFDYADEKNKKKQEYEVISRKSDPLRCAKYCPAKAFCKQYATDYGIGVTENDFIQQENSCISYEASKLFEEV